MARKPPKKNTHGRKPMSPTKMPKAHGRKPPAPRPHASRTGSGNTPTTLTILAFAMVAVPALAIASTIGYIVMARA